MNKKGFIGAIGDDLPSLIPIIVALLMFFTTFSVTLSTYNSQNFAIEREMSMLSVARTLKGDSLLLSVDQFLNRCDDVEIGNYPYNFMVAIYDSDYDLEYVLDDFQETEVGGYISPSFLEGEVNGSPESFFCGYKKLGSGDFGTSISGTRLSRIEYTINYYPIAVQSRITAGNGEDYYVIAPAIMAMVIWQ